MSLTPDDKARQIGLLTLQLQDALEVLNRTVARRIQQRQLFASLLSDWDALYSQEPDMYVIPTKADVDATLAKIAEGEEKVARLREALQKLGVTIMSDPDEFELGGS